MVRFLYAGGVSILCSFAVAQGFIENDAADVICYASYSTQGTIVEVANLSPGQTSGPLPYNPGSSYYVNNYEAGCNSQGSGGTFFDFSASGGTVFYNLAGNAPSNPFNGASIIPSDPSCPTISCSGSSTSCYDSTSPNVQACGSGASITFHAG